MAFHRWRSPRVVWDALKPRARALRNEDTVAESELWERLRDRRLMGHKFRRQHSVGGYIVDFICPDARLVIEIDGAVHDGQEEADRLREAHLRSHGLRVIRFRNDEIADSLDALLERIQLALSSESAKQ